MTEQANEARKAYRRRWAKQNPEKVRAQQERYWARRAEREAQAAQIDKPGEESDLDAGDSPSLSTE